MAGRGRSVQQRVASAQGGRLISRVLANGKVFKFAKNGRRGPDAVIVLKRNPKHSKKAFEKKMNKLMDLGKKGKLKKNLNPRNGNQQAQLRRDVQREIDNISNPKQRARVQKDFDSMDADHIQELESNGLDVANNLWLIDGGVNRSVGSQIMHRLKHLDNGETFQVFVSRW